jgi:plasmid stabilization system protein ParE
VESIAVDSIQNAQRVYNEIDQTVEDLSYSAQVYSKDPYYLGSKEVRKFTHKNIRVSFSVTDTQVRILKVSHAKRKPQYWLR